MDVQAPDLPPSLVMPSRPPSNQSGDLHSSPAVELNLTNCPSTGPLSRWVKGQRGISTRLPPHLAPVRQFIPAVSVCMEEMKRHWDKGFARLDIQDMGELELAEQTTTTSPPVANHLHPGHRATFLSAGELLEEMGHQLDAGSPNPSL